MNKFLYIYNTELFVDNSFESVLDISMKVDNYLSTINHISDKIIGKECLIFDENCFEIKSKLFELVTFFRLNKTYNWDIPIFIFQNESNSNSLLELLKCDNNNIFKTKRIDIINSKSIEIDDLTGQNQLYQNLNIKLNETLNFNEFVNIINVEGSSLSNHSITNEWAIYRWSKTLNISDTEIEKITDKLKNDLYFKYLQAKYPITESKIINKGDLKIITKINPNILYIDDDADKGWYEIFCHIFYDINGFNFNYLGDELKGRTQKEIIDLSLNNIIGVDVERNDKNAQIDIVLLDFRLHPTDQHQRNIEEITGYKILKAIKEYNPGIQVIIVSATNKVWNFDALQKVGADGFILKENIENSIDPLFTRNSIFDLNNQITKSINLIFLKDIYMIIYSIKRNLRSFIGKSKQSDFLKIKLNNEISVQLDLAYDCLSNSFKSVSNDLNENHSYFNLSYISLFKVIELISDYYTDETGKYLKSKNQKIKKYILDSKIFEKFDEKKFPSTFDKLLNIYEFELECRAIEIAQTFNIIKNNRNNIIHPKELKYYKKTNEIDNTEFLTLINHIISKLKLN